jgi:hypothetical protein
MADDKTVQRATRLADVTFMAVLGTGLVLLLAGGDSASATAPEGLDARRRNCLRWQCSVRWQT